MQCRRWWIAASVLMMVAMGAGGARTAQADPAKLARDLEAAHGKDAVDIKDGIVAPAKTMSPPDKNKYAESMCKAFDDAHLLDSKNVEAQLNAIMTIVELDALDTDSFLKPALKNANPSVRYWAAKGLGQIMDRLVRAGASGPVIKALQDRLKVETSGVVKQQIVSAIAASNDFKEVLAALKLLAADLQKNAPDASTIKAAWVAVDALKKIYDAPPPAAPIAKADATEAVASAAAATSFAAQQNFALNDKKLLPSGNQDAARQLAESAVTLFNTVGKLRLSLPPVKPTDGPEELLLEVNSITGSPSIPTGELQKTMPEVTAPPAITPK
jgi:hypothetical protein